MAMTKGQEESLKKYFESKLKEQYERGFQVGVLTICKTIFDKLNDSSKPIINRIENVKKFCETPWNKLNEAEQALKDATAKLKQTEDNLPDDDIN